MADITATKERFYRLYTDEFACVRFITVTRILDDEGEVMERQREVLITPDDDISSLPLRLRNIVTAARYPEAVERYEQRKAANIVGNYFPAPTP
jgi:hypothetical protein